MRRPDDILGGMGRPGGQFRRLTTAAAALLAEARARGGADELRRTFLDELQRAEHCERTRMEDLADKLERAKAADQPERQGTAENEPRPER